MRGASVASRRDQSGAGSTGFDRIAAHYDRLWTETPEGLAQRAQVWREIDGLFRAGERILDVGCGTGADAAHLVQRGMKVYCVDASPAMVAVCDKAGLDAAVLRAEDAREAQGVFDGALSNFGALNCVADLRPVAEGLAAKVRSGGYLAVCTIGRFCAWETLRFAARLEWRKAARRWSGVAGSSLGVTVYYHTVAQMQAAFEPHFEMQRWTGIGRPAAPRAWADHRLLIFTRK